MNTSFSRALLSLIASIVLVVVFTPVQEAFAWTGAKNKSYVFSAQATDPEGDQLYYVFNWGFDGNNNGSEDETRAPASGTAASGTSQSASYAWDPPFDTGAGYIEEVYTVYVVAYDANNNQSQPSSNYFMTVALPSKPGPLTSNESTPTLSTDGTFNLTWTASNPHSNNFTNVADVLVSISQYDVWRQFNGGTWSPVGTPSSNAYSETNIPDGDYSYYVLARDNTTPSNVSPQSNQFDITVDRSIGGGSAPTANFDFCTLSSDTVQLRDLSSDSDGTVEQWEWDFGDGTTYSPDKRHPLHNFSSHTTSLAPPVDQLAEAQVIAPRQPSFTARALLAAHNLIETAKRLPYKLSASFTSFITSLMGQPASAQPAWWDTNWARRRQVTFNNSAQAENLINFPVLIKINAGRIDYGQTQNAGQDIRFIDADGTTVLSYEIETWNEAGDSYVWVKAPQINASSNSDYIWMYYGNTSATDAQSASTVWNNSYDAVWHLNNSFTDASPNGRTAANSGSTDTAGVMGRARDFNGSSQYVDLNFTPNYGSSADFSWEVWVHADVSTSRDTYLGSIDTDGSPELDLNWNQGSTPDNWSSDVKDSAASGPSVGVSSDTYVGTWRYIALTHQDSVPATKLYVDGAQVGGAGAGAGGAHPHSCDVFIGAMDTCPSTAGAHFNGQIDEVRASSAVRSAAWISAQHKSMTDVFNAFASEETVPISDLTAPTVTSFTAAPASMCSGASATVTWAATDTVGVDHVEVWHNPNGAGWVAVPAGNGDCNGNKAASGSCTVTSVTATTQYGAHALDAAGNCITEAGGHCGGITSDSADGPPPRTPMGPDEVAVLSAPTTPGQPTPSGSAGNTTVSWTDTANEMNYDVWRNTTNDIGTATEVAANLAANATSWLDTSTSCNTTYYYWIEAKNTCTSGTGPLSAAAGSITTGACTDLTAPTVTSFTAAPASMCSGASATVTWAATDTVGVDHVEVWHNPNGAGWVAVPAGNGDCNGNKAASGSCTVTSVTATTQYGAHALDAAGNCITEAGGHCGGITSDSADGPPPRTPMGPDEVAVNAVPGSPGDPTYSGTGQTNTTVTWSAATGATTYDLYRCTGAGCAIPGTATYTGVASPYSDATGLACDTTYRYWVKANNSCGASTSAQGTSVTTAPCTVPLAAGFNLCRPDPTGLPNTVNFTDTTAGGVTPYSYVWNFGDGSSNSIQQSPSHSFGGAGSVEFDDQFTRSADATLATHAPITGGGYTAAITTGTCTLYVESSTDDLNAATSVSSGGCGGTEGQLYQTANVIGSADYEVSVVMTAGDTGDDYNFIAIRIQASGDMYALRFNTDNTNQNGRGPGIYKRVGGTWGASALDSISGVAIANGSTVKLQMQGNTIKTFDDGVEIASYTDPSPLSTAGRAGIGMGAVMGATIADDMSAQQLDNFRVTTLGASPPFTVQLTVTDNISAVDAESQSVTPSAVASCAAPDTLAPTFTAYTAAPALMCAGSSAMISWTAYDTVGIDHVEIWHNPGSGWVQVPSGECSGSKGATGFCAVIPTATTQYGAHALDAAGNCITEAGGHCGGITSDSADGPPPRTPMGPDEVAVNAVPGSPGDPTYSGTGQTNTTVTWSAATGATTYDLYRCTGAGCAIPGTATYTGVASPYSDATGLACDTTYRYWVKANNSCGASTSAQGTSVTTSACGSTPSNWWNTSWTRRRQITFNNTTANLGVTAEVLQNVPVLVKLNASTVDYGQIQNTGQDIRFIDADANTLLPHEIETWNTAGDSYVWVKVPQIDVASSDFIWVYYGNASALDGQNSAGVWTNGYDAVWHLNNNFNDASPNGRTATNNGSVDIAGVAGRARDFNGSSQYVDSNFSPAYSSSQDYSWELWVRAESSTSRDYLLGTTEATDAPSMKLSWHQGNIPDSWDYEIKDNGGIGPSLGATNDAYVGTWRYIALTYQDGANPSARYYVDGVQVSSGGGASLGAKTHTCDVFIGALDTCGTGATAGSHFNGQIDEVRASGVFRSAAWIAAQYRLMSDGYAAFGSEESNGGGGSGAPAAPTNLAFSAVGQTDMTLNWTDNATDETAYRIYRDTSATKPGSALATLGANVTTYDNTDALNCGTLYYWWVEAYNGSTAEVNGSQATSVCAGGIIQHEETITGSSGGINTVATASAVTGATEHLYLAAISTRPNITVNSINGLGLTWSLIDAQCGTNTKIRTEVWKAIGTPSGNSVVTANLATSPTGAVIAVSRYSGVNAANPTGNIVSKNGNGIDGSCSGGTETSTYSADVTAAANNALIYSAAGKRNRTHDSGAGYTERADIQSTAILGTDQAGVAVQDKTIPIAATVPADGIFSSPLDWSVVAVEVRPSAGGPDTIAPTVTAFSPSVSSVCSGGATTLSWSATDNIGVSRVEVWENTGSGWVPVASGACSGDKPASGTCAVSPSGTTQYGIHALDAANNCITEGGGHCGGVFTDASDPRASLGPDTVTVTSAPWSPGDPTYSGTGQTNTTVTWSAATGATTYDLYRCTGAGCAIPGTATYTGVASPYSDATGLACDTTYRYWVKANNSCGASTSAQGTEATTAACGGGSGLAVEETLTGATVGTSLTLPSWTPQPNELVLVAVALRSPSNSVSVSGNGLTFVQVADVDHYQAENGVTVFRAMGATPSNGQITIALPGNTNRAIAVAVRISGTDTSGVNGAGAIEAIQTNTGANPDNNDMRQNITTLTAGAWALGFGTHRDASFNLPTAETAISINNSTGSGTSQTSISVWYESVSSPALVFVGALNDISLTTDWTMAVMAVKPGAGGGPTPPAAPSNLTFSSVTQTGMMLDWSDNATDEDGYKVYYNTVNSKPGSAAATLAANTTSYPASGLLCGTNPYYWWVEAYKGASTSQVTGNRATNACTAGQYTVALTATDNAGLSNSPPFSRLINFATAPSCSSLFSLTSAVADRCNRIGLQWTAAMAANSYTPYRRTCTNPPTCDNWGSWTPLSNTTALAVYDTSVAQSSTNQYYIAANLPSGTVLSSSTGSPSCTGSWSGSGPVTTCPLTAITEACAPSVTPLPVTSPCGVISLSWSTQPGALSYRVWRAIGADNFTAAQTAGPIASGLTSTSYQDRDIVPDVDYYYYVSDEKDPVTPSASTRSKSSCFRGSRWQER